MACAVSVTEWVWCPTTTSCKLCISLSATKLLSLWYPMRLCKTAACSSMLLRRPRLKVSQLRRLKSSHSPTYVPGLNWMTRHQWIRGVSGQTEEIWKVKNLKLYSRYSSKRATVRMTGRPKRVSRSWRMYPRRACSSSQMMNTMKLNWKLRMTL